MSDLREWLKDASLTEIEAELQKRDRLRDQINDAYVRTEASLTEANKLLEQTIEVLEGFNTDWFASYRGGEWEWYVEQAKPLLDNLKALTKEGTE